MNFLRLLGCLFLCLTLLPPAFGQDLAAKGFDHFYNLEFDQSVSVFESLVRQRPDDAKVHNHLAQAVLYREMHRGGALESELVSGNNPFLKREKLKPSIEDQKRFEDSNAKALEICAARLAKDPNDIDALYAQGVAYGLRANYLFLVKKAWMDALRDATSARKAHAKVIALRPEMVDAHLVEGLHDYVVGSLPWTYKLLGFLVGFRGDKEGGIRALQMVAEKGTLNRNDAKVLLGVVYRRERKPELAIPLLRDLMRQFPRNYLYRLEMVQMYADMGDKQKALETLAELDKLRQLNTPGLAALLPEKINYSRGNLLFWYRDYDTAISELRKATGKAKELDLNTGSMAWLRLGQCYDMKQKRSEAESAYRAAIQLAPDSDAARQSRQYLSSPYKRAAS